MFTSSLNEEVKSIEDDIEAVKDKVDDPVICEKVRQYVFAPREIQAIYKNDAGRRFLVTVTLVLNALSKPRRRYTYSLWSFVRGRSQHSHVRRCNESFDHTENTENT
jgi:hypothetical protein